MLALLKNDPFSVFDQVFPYTQSRSTANFSYDVRETEDAWFYEADVPGASKETTEVSLKGNRLDVTAVRTVNGKEFKYSGSFVVPSQHKKEAVKATVEHGVLRIELPKAQPDVAKIPVS